jgi:ribonuclease J
VEDALDNSQAVEELMSSVNAVFFTHYHGDHIGLSHHIPDSIPLYIGKVARDVVLRKLKQLSRVKGREELSAKEISATERMRNFSPKETVAIGDIHVTPFFVSHSAYDAYMFLIEAEGKRILHTGDFRGHGYLSKGLRPTIERYILKSGPVDFLITEGTMLSRINETVLPEVELKKRAVKLMNEYKSVFVMCSSTDMERLASFYSANDTRNGRPFVCDGYQADILQIFTDSAGKESSLFQFGKPYVFGKHNQKLLKWMKSSGFCMLVRPTGKFDDYFSVLEPLLNMDETVLIYSMWGEYVNPDSRHANDRYLKFIGKFPAVRKLHTSGHAEAKCLSEVCNLVNPRMGIIPIHSTESSSFRNLPLNEELKDRILTGSKSYENVTVRFPGQ